jgi:hypothetical protein
MEFCIHGLRILGEVGRNLSAIVDQLSIKAKKSKIFSPCPKILSKDYSIEAILINLQK